QNEARAVRPRSPARACVLSRANSAAIAAPCVLVAHPASAPGQRVVIPSEFPGPPARIPPMVETGTMRVKSGLAEMLKGGVIMDVTTAEQARIAEEAGACAVMAL